MKTVVDTNVFVSGIFWGGPPSDVLDLWHQNKIHLCITLDIVEEYTRVSKHLAKKYPGTDINALINLVTAEGRMVPDIKFLKPVSRDPDDDKFIACAIAAKAKVIVSGDKDLTDLKHYNNIKILKPTQLLSLF